MSMRNINSRYFGALTLFTRWRLNIKTPNTTAVTNTFLAVTFLICFSVLPFNTLSAEEIIVVYPTGHFGTDASNVQAAINQLSASVEGGIVELKSHNTDGVPTVFNFGKNPDPLKRGSVYIPLEQSGPIEIRGEYVDDEDDDNDELESHDDTQELPQTVILGGYIPIRMWGGGELTIQHLQFQEAYRTAIWVGISDSITIQNNVFLDTEGPTDSLTQVIRFFGYLSDENQITGTIAIRDNVIDGACCWFTDGIAFHKTNAETIVTNNDISGVNMGIRLGNYAQAFKAVGNNISSHVPAPDYVATGLTVTCGIGKSPAVTIVDNHIESRDDTLRGVGTGIVVLPNDLYSVDCEISNVTIKNNDILLTNGFSGIIGEAGRISDGAARLVQNRIIENSVSGNAQSGIKLWAYTEVPDATTTVEIAKNKVLRNDLQDLDAEIADIELDEFTSNNLVVAYPGDLVIDEGVNNRVIILPSNDDDDDD